MSDSRRELVTTVPVVEEVVSARKIPVETGRVQVHLRSIEEPVQVEADLLREEVHVERRTVEREVDAPPPPRREGDTLIVPVVEQRIVTRTVWVVTEEIHLTTRRSTAHTSVQATRQRQTVQVSRAPTTPSPEKS